MYILDYKDLYKTLKAKEYKSVYLLHGEEPYFIDKISAIIEREALSEAEQAFNQTILYGRDADHITVVDVARRFPMMAERQVVIIKEAQDMKTLTQLQNYIEKPQPSTLLVLCHKHKKLDMRTAFAKSVAKHAVVMESKPLYDNQVPDYVKNYLQDLKLGIEPAAAALIAEYLGTDLSKIANEMDKLSLNLPPKTVVNDKHIQEYIGISREYNVFELQRALSTRNVAQTNRIVRYFAENPKSQPLVMVISSLFGYFSKIYLLHFLGNSSDGDKAKALQLRSDYFLKEYKAAAQQYNRAKTETIINLLKEYDLKSKGVDADGTNEGELLKELVFKILY